MPFLLSFLLLTAFASSSRTAWMQPDAFHLKIGMTQNEAVAALESWNPKKGKGADEIVVDYDEDKAATLQFRKGRLQSIRFELFALLPEIRLAFDEQKSHLAGALGQPRKATSSMLIYDNTLPNVIVVVNDNPSTEQGKKGVGVLAVRYYDPR